MSEPISTKPYLMRAIYEWCVDNGYTPYIVVQVDEHTMVPMGHVQDGQITLNVSTLATNGLVLGNDYIEFQARFGGRAENVAVHIGAVSAIYSRETGAGMGFEVQPHDPSSQTDANTPASGAESTETKAVADTSAPAPVLEMTDGGRADAPPVDTPEDSSGDAKRPRLTIVK